MLRKLAFGFSAFLVLLSGTAHAHHSFAAFFDPDKIVTIKGTVTSFRFTNPHGTIVLDVPGDGATREWRVETNAPVVLVRGGWSPSSLKPGDVVTIEGWLARTMTNPRRSVAGLAAVAGATVVAMWFAARLDAGAQNTPRVDSRFAGLQWTFARIRYDGSKLPGLSGCDTTDECWTIDYPAAEHCSVFLKTGRSHQPDRRLSGDSIPWTWK